MPVRLEGGYETKAYWREVRELGNARLREMGVLRWTVTLRPLTADDVETADENYEEGLAIVWIEEESLSVVVAGLTDDLPVEEQVDANVVDFVMQAVMPDDDLDGDDEDYDDGS